MKKELIKLINSAVDNSEVPIAAVIVGKNGEIISSAYNKRNASKKTIDHAEIIAITKANEVIGDWRLNNCSMYVTLKPCDMCMSVIKESRISNLYYILDRHIDKKQYNRLKIEKLNDDYLNDYDNKLKTFFNNLRK